MKRLVKEFNEKHNTNFNINGVKRYLDIQCVANLCEEYLDYVNEYGNECSYTDSMVNRIKGFANEITEEF